MDISRLYKKLNISIVKGNIILFYAIGSLLLIITLVIINNSGKYKSTYVEAMEYFDIEFEGYDTYGKVKYSFNYNENDQRIIDFLNNTKVKFSKTRFLSNGEIITAELIFPEDDKVISIGDNNKVIYVDSLKEKKYEEVYDEESNTVVFNNGDIFDLDNDIDLIYEIEDIGGINYVNDKYLSKLKNDSYSSQTDEKIYNSILLDISIDECYTEISSYCDSKGEAYYLDTIESEIGEIIGYSCRIKR